MEIPDEAHPHCPILGKPVRRIRKGRGEAAEVSCLEYDVETGRCRHEPDPMSDGRLIRLLEALNASDSTEGMYCVMR